MNDWPPLSDYQATVGRLATDDDIRANRAAFILQSNGKRIGVPIDIPLPCYVWSIDEDTGDRQRCVVFQAEEADGKRYFGGWLIDEKRQVVGFESDFEIINQFKTEPNKAVQTTAMTPPPSTTRGAPLSDL